MVTAEAAVATIRDRRAEEAQLQMTCDRLDLSGRRFGLILGCG